MPYVEEAHLPVFSRVATRRFGAATVPVLVLDDGTVLRESTDIVAYVDTQTAVTPGPFPADAKQREACKAWIAKLDAELGPATRILAYDAIFRDAKLTRALSQQQGPMLERKLALLATPVVATMITRFYRIDAASVKRSVDVVEKTFGDVAAALADGRRFLCGDALTAADVTFAALAAVALYLPEYPFPLPDPSKLAPPDRDLVLRLRDTPAARFAERLYREERRGRA